MWPFLQLKYIFLYNKGIIFRKYLSVKGTIISKKVNCCLVYGLLCANVNRSGELRLDVININEEEEWI